MIQETQYMYIVNNESIRLCLKIVTDKHELTILQIAESHSKSNNVSWTYIL